MTISILSILYSFLLGFSVVNASPTLVTNALVDTNDTAPLAERDGLTSRTELIGFAGCSPKDKADINQAFKDAIMIVKGMGTPDDINFNHLLTVDYFGRFGENKNFQTNIKNNFRRVQAMDGHWNLGDAFYNRMWSIHCDDPGDKDGPRCNLPHRPVAYHVDAHDPKLKNDHPVINFCKRFFNDLRPTSEVIEDIDQGRFCCPKTSTQSMKSQGSHFLHEMFHTKYENSRSSGRGGGISDPQCIDYQVPGYPGLAYTPQRAKWLAKAQLAGAGVAYKNVDNYVYYAIGIFMWRKWKEVPWLPKAKWDPNNKKQPSRLAVRDEQTGVDDPDDSTSNTQSVTVTKLMSKVDMYGTNEPLQCVGTPPDQPSTTQSYAEAKIKEFCDPNNSAGSPQLDAHYNYWPVGYAAGDTAPWTDNGLWLSVSWNPDAECEGKELSVDQANCERLLGVTVNGCNTDTRQKKYGGTIFSGCGVYDLKVRDGVDRMPPLGRPTVRQGAVTPWGRIGGDAWGVN
ncbi:MAG: hypothetical protein M1836_004463 [Candelina mexicana]|nr:MAG: hypothetical protein M1836_004463 [Candelina mexicana]